MKWLCALFFLSAAFLYFTLFFHSIIEFDQDLGRHLLLGELIIRQGSVPSVNLLSYTHPNFAFINSHWLSEVVFYGIQEIAGVTGLLWLKVIVLSCAFLLTLYTAFRYSKSLVATALAFVVMAPILLERTEIRPEIFSYLFTAFFLYVFLLDKKKLFFLLPIIEIFWVNTHIYFVLGPVLALLFFNRKQWYYLVLICFSTLLNPHFIAGALFPFTVFQNYGYSIVENQHIFFLQQVTSNPRIIYFEVALAFSVFVLFFTDLKKITRVHLLLLSLIVLPITAIRSFPLFFLLELPIIAYFLSDIREPIKKYLIRFAVPIVIICCIWTLVRGVRLMSNEYYVLNDLGKRFGSSTKISGKGALDFVIKNNLKGPIFNSFDNGSYISYRLYPSEKVFVDGRPEAYPQEFFQELYIPLQQSPENFAVAKEKFKFSTIIFSHVDGTPWAQQFLSFVISDPDFHLVYLDSYSLVLVRQRSLPEVKPESLLSFSDDYLDNYYLARVADIFGWSEVANKLADKSIFENPHSSFAQRKARALVFF